VNRCPELVKALDQAGLRAIAASVVGDYFPEENPMRLARKDNLCEGAEPIVHYHFFDEAGALGSLDENEDQVDDGTYEIIGDRTFVISKEFPDMTFHHEIKGDTLSLSPRPYAGDQEAGFGTSAHVQRRGVVDLSQLSGSRMEAGRLRRLVLANVEASPSGQR
jgi:hypothetical protein